MQNTKKIILVPIDFSLESIHGLRTAMDIARNLWCEILLLHIMKESDLYPDGDGEAVKRSGMKNDPAAEAQLINQRREQLRGLRIQYHIPRVRINMFVLVNPGLTGLEKIFVNHKIDLIVVGAKGKFSACDYLDVDKRLMKQMHLSGIPLLVVHEYKSKLKYTKLLMHFPFRNYDENSVRLIDKFTELLNMNILVTHTKEVNGDALKKNLSKYSGTHHLNQYTFCDTGISDEGDLKSFAVDHDVDLLMTTGNKKEDKIRLHVNRTVGTEISWTDNSELFLA